MFSCDCSYCCRRKQFHADREATERVELVLTRGETTPAPSRQIWIIAPFATLKTCSRLSFNKSFAFRTYLNELNLLNAMLKIKNKTDYFGVFGLKGDFLKPLLVHLSWTRYMFVVNLVELVQVVFCPALKTDILLTIFELREPQNRYFH